MDIFKLNGKVAIITGGNGGIGLAMARYIGGAGASIVIAARNVEKNKISIDELKKNNIDCISVEVNVDDERSCQDMVQKTLKKFTKIDILINNAGKNIRKKPEEYSLSEWTSIINTNLISMFICSKSLLQAFCQKINLVKLLT